MYFENLEVQTPEQLSKFCSGQKVQIENKSETEGSIS